MSKVGIGLVVLGVLVQAAESAAKASCTLNNTLFATSTVGAIVAPIEQFTPLPLGWTLIIAGSGIIIYNS